VPRLSFDDTTLLMASVVDKKLVDCYWFLQNQCKKGDACEYRHCKAAIDKSPCKFWPGCTNQNCSFQHPSAGIVNKERSQTPCLYFLQGKCTKGDACPFQHTAPEQQDKEIQEKKRKAEEELRKVQAAKRKEEEELARIKAQKEKLKRQEDNTPARPLQAKARQDRKVPAVGGTFARTVGQIVRDAQPQGKGDRVLQKKKERTAGQIKTKTKAPGNGAKQEPEPSGPISFGVKSLDQILKEKDGGNTGNTAIETQQTVDTESKSNDSIKELRKKNQQRFASAPTATTPAATTPAATSPKTTVVKEPEVKRKAIEEPKEQKRQKVLVEEQSLDALDGLLDDDDIDLEGGDLSFGVELGDGEDELEL